MRWTVTLGLFLFLSAHTQSFAGFGFGGFPGFGSTPPPQPSSVTVPSTSSTGSYTLSWQPSAGADFYRWKEQVGGIWSPASQLAAQPGVALTGRSNGSYVYRVEACRWGGACSLARASNTITVNTQVKPNQISSISLSETSSTDGAYTVSWGTASNNPTRYEWQESVNGSWGNWVSNSTSRSLAVTSKGDGVYKYRARACNSAGCGGYRESGNVTVSLNVGGNGWQQTGGTPANAAWSGDTPKSNGDLGVGVMPGNAGVSGGAATYSIPVSVPPGRKGMQPQVGLSYSSRSGNGLAGQGWSLNAGSSIHRCAGIYDIDGEETRNVQLTANDKLCLDGERLKKYEGAYGQSGSLYHPETDTTTRVTLTGSLQSTSASFTVEYRNGSKAYYGSTTESRSLRSGSSVTDKWLLTKKEDGLSKNNLIYRYETLGDTGVRYLTKIYYTGFNNEEGDRLVQFSYETRSDVRFDYLANTFAKQTQRLSKISTKVGTELVSELALIYKDSPDAVDSQLSKTTQQWSGSSAPSNATNTPQTEMRKSILDSLELCAWREDDTKECLPKTVLDMELWKAGYKTIVKEQSLSTYPEMNGSLEFGDYDGDAKADLVLNKVGVGGANAGVSIFSSATGQRYDTNLIGSLQSSARGLTLDYNLDGRPDLVGTSGTGTNAAITLARWNGNGYTQYNTGIQGYCATANTLPNGRVANSCQSYAMDANKDGKTDLVVANRSGAYDVYWQLYLNCHAGQDNNGTPNHTPCFEAASANTQVTDSTDFNRSSSSASVRDVNNDGYLDIGGFYFEPTGSTSGSNRYVLKELTNVGNIGNADFNGDGYPDSIETVRFGLTHALPKISYNQGNGTLTSAQTISVYRRVNGNLVSDTSFNPNYQFTNGNDNKSFDYNGDGLTDLLVRGSVAHLSNCPTNDPENNFFACANDNTLWYWQVLQAEIDASGQLYFVLIDETELSIVAPKTGVIFADYNGDGSVDIVTRLGRNYMTSGHAKGIYTYENPNGQANLLNQVTRGNDLNLVDEFQYDSLTSLQTQGRYTLTTEQEFPYVKFSTATQMVSAYKTSDGVGSLRHSQFGYSDARSHLQGRGFQGFKTVVDESLTMKTKTTTEFEQDFPKSGKVALIINEVKDQNGNYQRVSEADNDWTILNHENAFRVYPSLINAREYDLNQGQFLYRQTTTQQQDHRGNMLWNRIVYSESVNGPLNQTEAYTKNVYHPTSGWWLNKLDYREVTTSAVNNRQFGTDGFASINSGTDIEKIVRTTYDSDQWDNIYRLPKRIVSTVGAGGGHGSEVITTYNSFGLPSQVTTIGKMANGTNLPGRTVTTEYTADGYFNRLVKNALNHSTTNIIDPRHGQALEVTDPNGLVSTAKYDAFYRPIWVKKSGQPASNTRQNWCNGVNGGSAWCPAGTKYRVTTSQKGLHDSHKYFDALGREVYGLVRNFSNNGWFHSQTIYNNQGHIIRKGRYEKAWTNTHFDSYDNLGRLLQKRSPQANDCLMTTDYNYSGFTTDVTVNPDCGGHTLSMSRKYNGLKQLVWTRDAKNNYTRHAYDGSGNPIVIEDAKNNSITANYNALGHKQWVDDPNMGYKSFKYNSLGELEFEMDAKGDVITNLYDLLGRKTERYLNGTKVARWVWDEAGNRKGKGLLSFEENGTNFTDRMRKYYFYSDKSTGRKAIDQVKHRVYEGNSSNFTDFDTFYYIDANYGRPSGIKFNTTGLTLAYEYNSVGYLNKIKNQQSGYVYQEITNQNQHGKVTEQMVTNGLLNQTANYHSATSQMEDILVQTAQGNQLRHVLTFDYDGFSNLQSQSVTTKNGSQHTESYQYDKLHRLIESERCYSGSCPTNDKLNYSYNELGNITLKSDYASTLNYGNGAKSLGGNAGPNAVRSINKVTGGTQSFTYDLNGNRLTGDGKTLTYTVHNMPKTIQKGTVSSRFSYDANLARYKHIKSGLPNGETETTYYVDKLFEKVVKKTNGNTDEVTFKHYIGGVAVQTQKVQGTQTSWEIGFTHRDRLGSVITITDDKGLVKEHRSYDAFGKPRKGDFKNATTPTLISAILQDPHGSNDLITNRGFTDHEHLDELELIHMNGRVYDYNLGRFLSVDPFVQATGSSQSINPYSYVMNNPLAGTDPTGYVVAWEREECEERGGDCNNEVGKIFRQLGFEVSAGEVNLSNKKTSGSLISKFLKERKGHISKVDRFRKKKGIYTTSSFGVFYRIRVDLDTGAIDGDPIKISSSELKDGDTVFTNGILNDLLRGDGGEAPVNGRDHIFQVDKKYMDFVLYFNPTVGTVSDTLEALQDQEAFETGQGYTALSIGLGVAMINANAAGKNIRYIGHSQGGAITAAASRFAFDMGGKPLSNMRISLHGAPINDKFAAESFNRFGMSDESFAFQAQEFDPVHKIGGGNGSIWTRIESLKNTFNLFRDRYNSPHTLPCKPDPKATC